MVRTSTQATGRHDYEDYTSPLPDCLIHHMFSFLPTRDVIKTCILSKRWRSICTTISDLRFDSFDDNSFVDGVLRHYVSFKVRKFHLDIISKRDFCPSTTGLWVHFAIDHQVEDLVLIVNICWKHYWSPLLYNCSSLTKLCLRGCCCSSGQSVSWSSLKSLSIEGVGDDVLQKVLMANPVLEYLNLIRSQRVKRIHSRSLRELVIDDVPVMESPLEILTPHLPSLHARGNYFHEMIRIIEAPSLVNAELDIDSPVKSIGVMWCPKVEGVSLPNCKSPTVHIPFRQFSFPTIANMLAATPNLEKFVIIFESSDWCDHRIKYDEDLVLVKFLPGHASILENMVIKVMPKREVVDSHELLEVGQRLRSLHRASKHVAVIFNYLEEGSKAVKYNNRLFAH